MDVTDAVVEQVGKGASGEAGLAAAINAVVACAGPGTSRPANDPGINQECARKARERIDWALGECDVFELELCMPEDGLDEAQQVVFSRIVLAPRGSVEWVAGILDVLASRLDALDQVDARRERAARSLPGSPAAAILDQCRDLMESMDTNTLQILADELRQLVPSGGRSRAVPSEGAIREEVSADGDDPSDVSDEAGEDGSAAEDALDAEPLCIQLADYDLQNKHEEVTIAALPGDLPAIRRDVLGLAKRYSERHAAAIGAAPEAIEVEDATAGADDEDDDGRRVGTGDREVVSA